jgi:hypothetical protein
VASSYRVVQEFLDGANSILKIESKNCWDFMNGDKTMFDWR